MEIYEETKVMNDNCSLDSNCYIRCDAPIS